MKRFITLFLTCLLYYVSSTTALAQQADVADSIKTVRLHEFVVTATRSLLQQIQSPVRYSQLTRSKLGETNGSTLGSVVKGLPGIFLPEYGSGGTLQTLSFRGMAAEHSLILLNDIPVNNVQTGVADLRLIPIDNIEKVEIVRGGNSGLYGGQAVGGVVNIITSSPLTSSPLTPSTIELNGSFGSFASSRVALQTHVHTERNIGLSIGLSSERGEGNYPFILRQGGMPSEEKRSNSDYQTQSIFLQGDWYDPEGTDAHFMLNGLTSERGTPGPFLTPANQGNGRQQDEQLQIVGSLSTNINERIRFSNTLSFQNAYEHYADFLSIFPADNYYRNISFGVSPRMTYDVNPFLTFTSGIEVGDAVANGNALAERKNQMHMALYGTSVVHLQPIGTSQLTVSLYPSIRYDSYSNGAGEAVSPKIGINVQLPPFDSWNDRHVSLTLHSTLGRDFRPATFNELYYAGAGGYGNPTLTPERSTSFDAGVTLGYDVIGNCELDVTYFAIDTHDRIIWLPTSSQYIWSPSNIGQTRSSGWEGEFRWFIPGDVVELNANYTSIDARIKYRSSPIDPSYDKQLIYIPLETANLGIELHLPIHDKMFSRILLRLDDHYVGDRYTVEDNSESLPAYHLIDGSAAVHLNVFGVQSRIRYEVNNLGDISYEVIPRYPMPPRNYTVSLTVIKSY